MRQIRCALVSGLAEIEECRARVGRVSDIVISQQEFLHLLVVPRLRRLHGIIPEPSWFRRHVCIKRRVVHTFTARPPTNAAHLVRISLPRNYVRPRPLRRPLPRKSRDCEIEAPPEKMHWAVLADESPAKLLKDRIQCRQDVKKALDIRGIV